MSGTDKRERFSPSHLCPICGGWGGMERGQGERCFGYTYEHDGARYAVCTREEYANGAPFHERSSGYVHRLDARTPRSVAHNARGEYSGVEARRIIATYDYRDESGRVLYQAVRYQPKGFNQRQPGNGGEWLWNLQGARLVLYRLPELLAADPAATLYLPEGEKDVENLRSCGFVATCNAMGAGKWRDEYNEPLRGRHVVILPDNDKTGADHARKVASALIGVAASVKVLNLPGLPTKGDVSDWLTSGGTAERLILLADATPEYVVTDDELREAIGDGWTPKITPLSEVLPEQVRWLWPGYIPLGKIVLNDGDPGLGKSTLTLDIAARVSIAAPMPDGSRSDLDGPAGVVLLSAEDGLADTIRPRLDAAGADVSRIVALECLASGERERGITLADLPHIEAAIERVDAKLVIVDPLMAYLGSETNSYRDQDVRGILAPLARLAERAGVAIVVVRHLSKGAQSNVLYRGGGSIGIIGAARHALMVGRDPEDQDGPRRIVAVAKSNLAAFPPALAYHMTEAENGVVRIVWEGATHHTAAAITATMQPDEGGKSALDEAKDVLRTILADGRLPTDDVRIQARKAGVADRTLDRAKSALGVRAHRDGFGKDGVWYWTLPNEEQPGTIPHSAPAEGIERQQNDMALNGGLGVLSGDDPRGMGATDQQDEPDDIAVCRAWLREDRLAITSRQIAAARRLLELGDGPFGDVRVWRPRLAAICGVAWTEPGDAA